MASSSSSSSFPPVVLQHCSNVPVLFELLRDEEEQCRVWLRRDMNQIPDPLIDSLFARLIMSSSSSSTSSVPHSRSTVSELCELLEGEKVETRMVLRSEMDRIVNTLFEKLTNNLRTNTDLNRSEDGGDRAQVVDTLDRVESANAISHEPSSLSAQPSTSSLNPVPHQQHSNGNEKEFNTVEMVQIKDEVVDGEETRFIDIEDLAEDNQSGDDDGSRSVENAPMDWVKQEIKEEFVDGQIMDIKKEEEDEDATRIINIAGLAEDNQGGGYGSQSEENEPMEWVKREIMEEEEDGAMMYIKKKEEDGEEINEVDLDNANEGGEADDVNRMSMNNPNGHNATDIDSLFARSMRNEVELGEPTRANLELSRNLHQIPNADVSQANASSNSNEDDEDDQVDEKLSRPVKRPRMDHLSVDPTQPNQPKVARQPTTATQPNHVIIQDKQIITLQLQCTELGCSQMFVPKEHYNMLDQLNDHLKYQHSIGLSRCLVKDCRQSFDKQHLLASHIKQDHANITRWHCDKCSKHYAGYRHLSDHNYHLHQLGHFQCSFPACTFTGEYKQKVHNHYACQHKDKPDLVCRQAGCDYRTKAKAALKAHELAHIGFKSYRCKWPNCGLVNAERSNVLNHIKTTHFGSKTSSSQDLTHLGKPADYIELM